MDTIEILKSARKLIEKPENWTQRAHARDYWGISVPSYSPFADCFCAVGAVQRVTDAQRYCGSSEALDALSREAGGHVPTFNDTHSHEEVLALFDTAIANLEAAQCST